MMRGRIAFSFLLALTAVAQQNPPEATFRTGTELVQVSVVAQDKNGKAVADLHREDFQVFDNGALQEIRLFLSDKPTAPPAVVGNLASGKIGTLTIPLSEVKNGAAAAK